MKKLMTFELYKSTYMSAASELEKGHKSRAEELKKHADERGISAFRGEEGFDMIHPHPFIFENYSQLKNREYFLGKFFITGFEDHVYGSYRPNYHGVKVIMQSDYGKKIRVELVLGPENQCKIDVEYGTTEIPNFKFENRKDAFQLRKFIFELVEDGELEDGDEYFTLSTLPINKLYSTE